MWWYTPFLPALRRHRKVDLCEFKVILLYTASYRQQGPGDKILSFKINHKTLIRKKNCIKITGEKGEQRIFP